MSTRRAQQGRPPSSWLQWGDTVNWPECCWSLEQTPKPSIVTGRLHLTLPQPWRKRYKINDPTMHTHISALILSIIASKMKFVFVWQKTLEAREYIPHSSYISLFYCAGCSGGTGGIPCKTLESDVRLKSYRITDVRCILYKLSFYITCK